MRGGDRGDARKRLNPVEQLPIKRVDLNRVFELALGNRKIEGQQMVGRKTEVDMGQVPQAVEREPASGQ